MRQFLLKASPVIDLIAQNQVPWGSFLSAELADDADLTDSERNTENLRRALRKKPLDKAAIETGLALCRDHAVLYEIKGKVKIPGVDLTKPDPSFKQ